MQDTLRSSVLGSVPFYDQKKVIALLDRLPSMPEPDLIAWDGILMSVLSACVLQQRFKLGRSAEEPEGAGESLETATQDGRETGISGKPNAIFNGASGIRVYGNDAADK
jgi:hypothetical protein